jgi:ribosome maturation factor RimP
MISEERIKTILEGIIADKNAFLVKLSVSKGNKIKILIDNDQGLSIDDCVQISRHVEKHLNRDEEDFDLEVSSPGLNEPLRVKKQYLKNIGRIVEVITSDGKKHRGELLDVTNDSITIAESKKVKKGSSKKKQTITEQETFSFEDINSTKVVVSFK